MSFFYRIKAFREHFSLNQVEFAQNIGTVKQTISRLEADEGKPSFDIIFSIKEKYPTIDLNWLVSGKGKMFVPEGQNQNEQPAEARKESSNCAECRAELAAAKDKIIELQNQIISHLNNTKNGL